MAIADFDDPNIDKDAVIFGKHDVSLSSRILLRVLNSVEDDSPYPEVRSAVANTDDPSIPSMTLRVWVIGVIWAMIIPGMNQFFFFRFPAVTVTGVCLKLSSTANLQLNPIFLDRCSVAFFPCWQGLGKTRTQRQGLWRLPESWTIQYQGARVGHYNGKRRCRVCIRGEFGCGYLTITR